MQQLFLSEPYLWLQYCFFQPVKFRQEFESDSLPRRLAMLLRLTPLIFLYTYTPALIIRIALYMLQPSLFPYYGISKLLPFSFGTSLFLLDATWVTVLSCLGAGLVGAFFSVRLGIALSFGLALADGIIANTNNDVLVGMVFGLAFGIVLGISFNSAHALRLGRSGQVTLAVWLGVVGGLLVGVFTGILPGYWAGRAMGTIFPVLQHIDNVVGSAAGMLVGGVCGGIIATLLGVICKRLFRERRALVTVGSSVGTAVAVVIGVTIGVPVGDAGVCYDPFSQGVQDGVMEALVVGIPFLLCYALSYYRLPLYPICAYAMTQAHLAARRTLHRALYCLQHSPLHWDECVYLPLPHLKSMLLLVSEQSPHEVLDEIAFIVRERPQQRRAAQFAAYELALRDLTQRTTLRSIGQAHQQLDVYLLPEIKGYSVRATKVFRWLGDASQEAASSQALTNKQERQEALKRMQLVLNHIPTPIALHQSELDQQLKGVVSQWSMLAEQVHETLDGLAGGFSIENPYVPGKILELRDPLFVGRDDVAQKLSQALQRRYLPTFLLRGERRMGKSSIISQLPVLLGSRYITVFYDLQRPSMLASAAAFFAGVTLGIERACRQKGLLVARLERELLDEAQQRGEVAVYDLLEPWFQEIEVVLEQADCIVILAFDEFEKLDEAEERKSIDLQLLYDFFRSMTQNRSRLALLFSGARLTGDMGRRWAGYFVNVELIKVGFLREGDARTLIMHPVPGVFSVEVADEIIRLTNRQPFLIQAMCNHIIERLSEEAREQATFQDVEQVIGKVFEAWAGYFWDLWDRSDDEQRACLHALHALRQASVDDLTQHCGLSRQTVQQALEKLQMRDLSSATTGGYHIAVPMFALWIEQALAL